MNDVQETTVGETLKDRSFGLAVFGTIQVCLGALAVLILLFTLAGLQYILSMEEESAAAAGLSVQTMIPALLFYLMAGAWFLSMGIGSFRARRWTQALVVASSWVMLISGSVALISFLLMSGSIYEGMAQSNTMPAGTMQLMKAFTVFIMVFAYILIPGAFMLFYRARSVRATCERRNPEPSWTDSCPQPLLAQVLLLSMWSIMVLSAGCYSFVFPFFGHILSGASGAAVVLMLSVVCALLAWGTVGRSMKVWWGMVALVSLFGVSVVSTFLRHNLMGLYEAMKLPEEQLALMRPMVENPTIEAYMVYGSGAWFLVLLGLVVYSKRYYLVSTPKG